MSLRLQINLIVTALMVIFSAVLIGLQIHNTRRSVHEEIQGANVVAIQLLSRMDLAGAAGSNESLTQYLKRVGRIRANEVTLLGPQGELIYRSPPSLYKAGRDAPQWYRDLVSPPFPAKVIELPQGWITVRADPSRAALDGWDDLYPMLLAVLTGFVFAQVLTSILIGRAMHPLRQVVRGLRQMEQGSYDTRLPQLQGREGRQMRHAFNAMAQSVEDSATARRQAQEATQALAESRELMQYIQTRIESERGAIARELHDELGQQVTAIKSASVAIARKSSGRDELIEQSARLVMECADQIYDGVHRLVSQLRPLALDRFGLRDALHDLLIDWRQRQSEVKLQLTLEGAIDDVDHGTATAIYRIVQEALNNALRHAQAGQIDVILRTTATQIELKIADDGCGQTADFHAPGHFGLIGMRERAQALGGTFSVLQQKPAGTEVHAVFNRLAS